MFLAKALFKFHLRFVFGIAYQPEILDKNSFDHEVSSEISFWVFGFPFMWNSSGEQKVVYCFFRE